MIKVNILYEADCSFCNVCRRFVKKRDLNEMFIFIDIYSEDASDLIQKTGHPERPEYDSIVVTDGQNLYLEKYPACLYPGHLLHPCFESFQISSETGDIALLLVTENLFQNCSVPKYTQYLA